MLLASIDNVTVFRGAGEGLGERFMYVAPGVQMPEALTDAGAKAAVDSFLKAWTAKYGDADPYAAARAYDTMMVIANGVTLAKSDAGPAVREAIEKLPTYQGAAASYSFSADQHVGIVQNPFFIGIIKDGKLVVAK